MSLRLHPSSRDRAIDPAIDSTAVPAPRLLTGGLSQPNFRTAVAPVTQTLGDVTGRRQHWSGVVRRGAVDTTPVTSAHRPANSFAQIDPRNHA